MADVNQIKIPNGSTYNIVDTEGRKEENLVWGGPSKAGDVSPIGMALSNEHSANRMAFFPGECVKLEYSSDGGSTYAEYPSSPYDTNFKKQLCTDAVNIPIGRTVSSTNYTTSSRTRITFTVQDGTHNYMYSSIRKMLIQVSLSGEMNVKLEGRTGKNYVNNVDTWYDFGTYAVAGWSGWNDIPLVQKIGGGSTQTSQIWQLRLTFIITTVSSSSPKVASVMSIRMYGSSAWATPSTMAKTGHLYTFDINQNATFPAQVSATKFNGTATNADKVNNLTVQTAVPANAKFSDTTYESKAAASGGTDVSLCTTGEKYTWNNKMNKTNPTGSGSFHFSTGNSSNIGSYAVAMGFDSEARGTCSSSIGTGTIAKNAYQHVIGRFNIEDPGSSNPGDVGTYAEIVGNGSSSSSRSNARTLDWSGNEVLAGGLKINGTEDVITTSKSASSGGTDLSLVTTGDKYNWNNKVDNITTSGTITANTSDGWTANGWCKKYGNIVSFYIDGNKSSALASGWNTVATLPVGFRPTNTFDFAMIDPGSDFASEGKVNANGTVQVYKNSNSTTRIRCQTTFII